MYYINSKQEKILGNINKFGCMTYDQIKKLNNLRDLDKQLKTLVRQRKLKILEDNIYVTIGIREVNRKILRAIDIYIYLINADKEKNIEWCTLNEFPFVMSFFRNGKVFDVAVIEEGEELIYSTAINRSVAERIIIVIENEKQIEKIKINEKVKYCTIKDGAVIFL
ncbi:DUF5697 family protein [Clostridium felsineum]|uniref:Uncharacterized protein n=1 Tax=Clostridium felsineum TaxID=36839 RepID=A0A1S8LDA5_9CLOT|nr:DUF5697 family protein [Clostridium felsineum]URZ05934.1 hypothetical protein CLROS_012660 [Clostridium felsineum]URZ10971.1 hypothetical protein CROST_016870 [Clostridium felsineum]